MDETWQSHMNWHDKKRETQITLPHCELWVVEDMTYESIPNGSAKSQNKLKYSLQAPKMTPSFTWDKMGFCYSYKPFMPCTIHLPFYFYIILFAPWLSKQWNQLALLPSLSLFSFFFFLGFFCWFFFFFRSVMVMVCVILLWCAGLVLIFFVILLWKFVNLLLFSVIFLWKFVNSLSFFFAEVAGFLLMKLLWGRSKKKGRGYVSGGKKKKRKEKRSGLWVMGKKKEEGDIQRNRGRSKRKMERKVFWELRK